MSTSVIIAHLDGYLGVICRGAPVRGDGGIVEDGHPVGPDARGTAVCVLQGRPRRVKAGSRGDSDRVSMLWCTQPPRAHGARPARVREEHGVDV